MGILDLFYSERTAQKEEPKDLAIPVMEMGKDTPELGNIEEKGEGGCHCGKIFKNKGKDRPDKNYDEKELAMGIEVEMEHTNDKETAEIIAKDHLDEMKDYYSKLKVMEGKGKEEKVMAQVEMSSMKMQEYLERGEANIVDFVDVGMTSPLYDNAIVDLNGEKYKISLKKFVVEVKKEG